MLKLIRQINRSITPPFFFSTKISYWYIEITYIYMYIPQPAQVDNYCKKENKNEAKYEVFAHSIGIYILIYIHNYSSGNKVSRRTATSSTAASY